MDTILTKIIGRAYSESDPTKKFGRDEAVMSGLYLCQFVVMVASVSTRYFKTRDTGVYSLRVGRPRSYLLKHMLHLANAIALIGIIVASCLSKPYSLYNYLRIVVSGGQLLVWIFSALLLRFEYRR